MNVQLPRIIRPFFRNTIWRKTPSEKVIYLTFDDGPVPEVTPSVLDILDKYGWKATFFCVGENVLKYPELYNEVLRRGHRTGNHSFNHIKGFNYSTEAYVENVKKAAEYIYSDLFRPPYGRITRKQISALKDDYNIVMWDVITRDYNNKLTPEEVYTIVKRYTRNGSIIVFHDSVKSFENIKYALPASIDYLLEQNYTFDIL